MKFLVSVSLLGIVFQSVGEGANVGSHLYPMISTYASEIENCDVDDLNIDSLSDVKDICRSLINSEVCSNVKRKYRIDCDTLVTYTGQVESLGANQVEWPETSSVDHMKGVWLYSELESDRLNEESLLSYFMTNFSQLEQEPEFSCLNNKGKMKVWHKYVPSSKSLESILKAMIRAPSDVMNSPRMEEASAGYLGLKIMFATIGLAAVTGATYPFFKQVPWRALMVGMFGGFAIAIIEELLLGGPSKSYGSFNGKKDRNIEYKIIDSTKAMNSIRKNKVRR